MKPKQASKDAPAHKPEQTAPAQTVEDSLPETKQTSQPKLTKHDIEVETYRKRSAELEDHLRRLQAEFENYQKRSAKDMTCLMQSANCSVLARMLPFLDSLEQAIAHADAGKDGLVALHKQLWSILSAEGLRPIEATGKRFDPYQHEVLCQENHADKEDELVLDEIQRGYTVNGRIIRHAKVKINRVRE
jgi:molecular chaperone GrpE